MPSAATAPRASVALPSQDDIGLFHAPIYIDPALLIDSANVRPDESPESHKLRIRALAREIKADGQQLPIKITEVEVNGDLAYKVVDGQGRAEALRQLNRDRRDTNAEPLLAWCVLDFSGDPWATAVKLNVQRTNYTDLQLASLIREARARYGWDTKKGGGKLCADFFGMNEQLLAEFNTIADAPQDVKDQLQSGVINRYGALTLMRATDKVHSPKAAEKRSQVMEEATKIATASAAKKPAKANDIQIPDAPDPAKPAPATARELLDQAKAKKTSAPQLAVSLRPVKVEARHIAEASRRVATKAGDTAAPLIKRTRTEILAALGMLRDVTGPAATTALLFLAGLQKFAEGDLSPTSLKSRWMNLVGAGPVSVQTPPPAKAPAKKVQVTKPAPAAVVKKAPAKAVKAAKVPAKKSAPKPAAAVKKPAKKARRK